MIHRRPKALVLLLTFGLGGGSATAPVAAATDFSLFGDVTLVDSDAPLSPASFALGVLDFYVLQEINDNLTVGVELAVEAEDGGDIEIDLERMWIRYEVSPAFQIAAGRFHTPLGFWNRHYHHGALIQDTVARPFILEFEDDGGVLPVHVVGLMATGDVWAGVGTLRYEVVVGNGQELSSQDGLDPAAEDKPHLDPNNVGDNNGDKSLGGRVSLSSDRGWQVGVFGLTQEIAESGSAAAGSLVATGETLVEQTIFGFDVRFEAGRFGFLGELYEVDNDSRIDGAGRHDATAFYSQAWYDLTDKWRLSTRFESFDLDPLDPFYRLLAVTAQDRGVLTFGYRRDEVSVIKLEVERLQTDAAGLGDVTVGRVQWAFLIP